MKMEFSGLCTYVFILLQILTASALMCYHDVYGPPGSLVNTTEAGDRSKWVKQCGVADNCESCMTVNTKTTRYEKGKGQQEYIVLSRVCTKVRETKIEEGCERLGPPSPADVTTVCHCFRDKCNTGALE